MIGGFIIAIAVHEFSHAASARLLGDRTAQDAGRLTLNPIRHLDPMGTLLLVITALNPAAPGFGWGKPVPVDPGSLRFGRFGMALVSAAGPASNLLLAIVIGVLVFLGIDGGFLSRRDWIQLLGLNVGLCAFNLLPIAPLDGFGVLVGVLPWSVARRLAWLGQYGPGILLILVFSGAVIGISLLRLILDPVLDVLLGLVGLVSGWLASILASWF